jgi:hypothetical protein
MAVHASRHESPQQASGPAPEQPGSAPEPPGAAPGSSPGSASEPPGPPPGSPPAGSSDDPFDAATHLDRLSKIVLAAVPALTVALAAVGSATGGLARLFRDQTTVARLAVGLVFLSFLLAALASRTGAGSSIGRGSGRRALLLLLSSAAFIAGAAWAFDAQIAVMGSGEAPIVTGSVTPSAAGATLSAHVVATGVRADKRVVVFAFESSDDHGTVTSRKVPLYYSKTGPDPDGKVDMDLAADLPGTDLAQYPYVFVTAVLGEEQRDCDGVLLEGQGAPAPTATACLTLQRPGAGTAASSPPAAAAASVPSAPLATARVLSVPGAASWTTTGVALTRGQHFTVQATGTVSYAPGSPLVGPDGATDPHPGVCVLPGPDHHAALIGRIGTGGTPFLVGHGFAADAPASGVLDLGINDTGVDGNGGAFRATVQVAQP